MKTITVKISGLIFSFFSGFLVVSTPASDLFQPLDVFNLEFASHPHISPDGKRVVYVRNYMDIMTDRQRGTLWTIQTNGNHHKPLTDGERANSSPRWSPDGKRIVYTSSPPEGTTGPSQIYLRWFDSGETARLSQLAKAPQNLRWSPDGKWIAFTMLVPKPIPPMVKPPAKPKGAAWADPPRVIDKKMLYRYDGKGFLEDGFTHLFVLPAEGGTPRQLTTGDFNIKGAPAWMPDGKSIVFASNRRFDWEHLPRNTEIYRVSIANGDIKTLTDRDGPDEEPAVSPDGSLIAYIGYNDRFQGYLTKQLYVIDPDGNNRRALTTADDPSFKNPAWGSSNSEVYAQTDVHGVGMVYRIPLEGKMKSVVKSVGGTYLGRPYPSGMYSISKRSGNQIAYTATSTSRPADLAVGKKIITDLNGDLLDHKRLGKVEERWVESSHDKKRIQYWVVKPPGFKPAKKYPMILEIHGGPFSHYGERFGAEIQLYAAAGYVVVYANPRGSGSYSEDFATAIHHAYPGFDYDDLMSVVDHAISEGYIDSRNLFVTGGSAGGIMTAWIVGKTDRFRAAVAAKPVINWTSFALTTDRYSYFHKYWFPGPPWEEPEHYFKTSPLSLVGNVKTPTMLLTGEADHRTPMPESEQFFQALKIRKVDTALVRFADTSHGISRRPSSLISKVAHVLKWFERYQVD